MADTHAAGSEDEVKRLRAEMAAAHPDRGGTTEAFAVARTRYVEARGGKQLRERAGGFKVAKDLAKLPNGLHSDRTCRGLYVQVRRDRDTGGWRMRWIFRVNTRWRGGQAVSTTGR